MSLRSGARLWIALAGMAGALGVAGSAAAVHGALANNALLETAARMLLLHAPAVLAVAWLADRVGGLWPALAGAAFLLGMVLFCGTLAAQAIGLALRPAGLAPAGGIAFIAAWLLLSAGALAGDRSGRM